MDEANIILILEDNEDRIKGFDACCRLLSSKPEIRVSRNAQRMIGEIDSYLARTSLISLDHDLVAETESIDDPGSGMDVVKHLSAKKPCCPVILHTSNIDASWSMFNEMRDGGWNVVRVGPIGEDWIQTVWLPRVRSLLEES